MANQKTVNLSQYYYRKSEIDAFINGGTLNGKHIYDHPHDYSKVTVTPKKDSGIEIAQIKVDTNTYSIKQQDTTYTPSSTIPPKDTTQGTYGQSAQYARADHAHPKSDLYAEAGHDHDGTYLKSYTPPNGSTSQAGIVKLNTSTSSTSTTEAATPSAVKSAYDLANGKPNLGETASTAAKGNHTHSNYIQTSAIKNDLTTGGETNVLSAEQGKTLKSMIENITYTDNETATDHNHDDKYVQKNDSRLSDSRTPLFTEIPTSSDLNTYRTGGFYYCASDPNSKTIKNCPKSMTPNDENYWISNKAFFLLVETWGASSEKYVKQTLTYYNDSTTFIRTKHNTQNEGKNPDIGWTNWKEIATTDKIIVNSDIADGTIESGKIKDGTIVNGDISSNAAIEQNKISNLTNDLTSKNVTLTKLSTATTGYIATYEIKQGGTSLGKIDIPKDYLVKSGSVETVTTANDPVSGYAVGDKYIDFVINTKDNSGTDEHIYINVKDLIDVYTHPNSGVEAGTNYNKNQTPAFGANFNIPKLTFNAQGHITASANSTVKIPNTLADGTTAGLSTNDYTTTEKTKLSGIATGATKNTVENSLTSTSTTDALSAAQGKILKDSLNEKISKSILIDASEHHAKDLNTYGDVGFYYCFSNNDRAKYVANAPNTMLSSDETFDEEFSVSSHQSFYLIVEEGVNDKYKKQTLTYWNNGDTYIRVKTANNGTASDWKSWEKIARINNIPNVINNLNSTSTTDSLSAAQGKELYDIANPLKERYDGVIYDTSGGTLTKPYAHLFHIDTSTNSSNSTSSRLIFEIIHRREDNTYGGYIKCSVFARPSLNEPNITILNRDKKINLNNLYFAFYKDTTVTNPSMIVDVFYKMPNSDSAIIKVYDDHLREGTYTQYTPIKNGDHTYIEINGGEDQSKRAGYILYGHDYTNVLNPIYEIQADKFINSSSNNTNILLGNGNTLPQSTFATSGHNHSGTYVDGTGTKNTTNGSAIAEIKANTTVKGTIYHPKVNSNPLTGVPTQDTTLTHGGTFTVSQPVVNTDGHITALNTRTYTLPADNNTTYSAGDGLTLSGTSFSLTDASNYVKKSSTLGYIKNDGTIGTPTNTTYTASINEDLIFFLGAILWTDNEDIVWTTSGSPTVTYENNIRTINNGTSSTVNIYSNNSQRYTKNWVCEFDVTASTSDSNAVRFYTTSGSQVNFTTLDVNVGSHIMITCIENVVKIYVDDTYKWTKTYTTTTGYLVGFQIPANQSLSFSNYIIYEV